MPTCDVFHEEVFKCEAVLDLGARATVPKSWLVWSNMSLAHFCAGAAGAAASHKINAKPILPGQCICRMENLLGPPPQQSGRCHALRA